MPQDNINKLNCVIGDNLSLLDGESLSASERRIIQLRDRAMLAVLGGIVTSGESRQEDFAGLFESPVIPEGSPEGSRFYLEARNRSELFSDKLTVCRFLAEELSLRGTDPLSLLIGEAEEITSPRIAYFRNAYADAAFRIFSEVLEEPSVVYVSDFTAVCEEVYYGRADMCMLPLDSSRDAKLISFYRLIDKYELSPVLSCDVPSPDGEVNTRYALLKRSPALPWERAAEKNSIFFELSLVPDEKNSLCDVLWAARECGLTLYKADSIPLTYSDSEFACDIILKVGDKRGLEAFVLFMTLAIPQYEPLGIYPHIPSKG